MKDFLLDQADKLFSADLGKPEARYHSEIDGKLCVVLVDFENDDTGLTALVGINPLTDDEAPILVGTTLLVDGDIVDIRSVLAKLNAIEAKPGPDPAQITQVHQDTVPKTPAKKKTTTTKPKPKK